MSVSVHSQTYYRHFPEVSRLLSQGSQKSPGVWSDEELFLEARQPKFFLLTKLAQRPVFWEHTHVSPERPAFVGPFSFSWSCCTNKCCGAYSGGGRAYFGAVRGLFCLPRLRTRASSRKTRIPGGLPGMWQLLSGSYSLKCNYAAKKFLSVKFRASLRTYTSHFYVPKCVLVFSCHRTVVTGFVCT